MPTKQRERMANLYELTDEWLAIQDEIEDRGGELDEELIERMDRAASSRAHKIECYCKLIRHAAALRESLRAEVERLEARAAAAGRMEERLKTNLKLSMEAAGEKRIEAGTFKVRIQTNSTPTVEFLSNDQDDIPQQYMKIKVDLDRAKVAEDWKRGAPIPEVLKVGLGSHIRIQ